MAKASDARLAKGEGGALEGIPLGIKDLFATKGVHTQAAATSSTASSRPTNRPSRRICGRDGAVMLGKLNMDEFAMGSSNETSYYGPVDQSLARGRLECRAAGAGRLVRRFGVGGRGAALPGRDREPTPAARSASRRPSPAPSASSRPTAAARAGASSPSPPRSTRPARSPGPCAIAAIMLNSMASDDPKDTTSVDLPVPDYEAAIGRSVKGMKIGIPKEYRVDGMPAEIEERWQQGIDWLKEAGAEIVDISLPHTKYALPAYYIVAPAEASSNLARYDGVRYGLRVPGKDIVEMYENTRAAGFGTEVKRRVMIGTYVLSAGYYDAYYLRAQKVRTLIKRDFDDRLACRRRCDPDAGDAGRGFRRRARSPIRSRCI